MITVPASMARTPPPMLVRGRQGQANWEEVLRALAEEGETVAGVPEVLVLPSASASVLARQRPR